MHAANHLAAGFDERFIRRDTVGNVVWGRPFSLVGPLMNVPAVLVCRVSIGLALALLTAGCEGATPVEGYKVIATYPHSTSSYTEGFFYLGGMRCCC